MALSRERSTPLRSSDIVSYPVAAGVVIYKGALVMLDGGYASPGAAGTDLIAVGRSEATIDNSAGNAGDARITVQRGTFLFENSATDAVAQADVGAACYVEDDATVAATDGTGTLSKAGIVRGIETGGVWVEIN